MLDRTRQAVFRFNVAQRGDALELLRSLPDRNASVALFNPQHRSVLDHLKFGNDLGIDPDLAGTLAIVETINGVPALIDAVDMPSTGTGAKARVDIIAAAPWIAKLARSTAYIERAQVFPGQGASSGFPYDRAVGAIEATIALCQIPTILVEASGWKRRLHLPGKDREAARQKTLQLFPAQHDLLARKKDHGRAEAALIVVASRLERMP